MDIQQLLEIIKRGEDSSNQFTENRAIYFYNNREHNDE